MMTQTRRRFLVALAVVAVGICGLEYYFWARALKAAADNAEWLRAANEITDAGGWPAKACADAEAARLKLRLAEAQEPKEFAKKDCYALNKPER